VLCSTLGRHGAGLAIVAPVVAGGVGSAPDPKNALVGTHTGLPQHEFTKQTCPPEQSELPPGQSVRPAQGVAPLTQIPPPVEVEPHTPLPPQVPSRSQDVKVEQVSPAHCGLGFELHAPWSQIEPAGHTVPHAPQLLGSL
jgi:hypothetical protein